MLLQIRADKIFSECFLLSASHAVVRKTKIKNQYFHPITLFISDVAR